MAKKIFIAAIDKNSGKTTTSICLMHLARRKYKRVGFFKPFGGQSVVFRKMTIDKDVALMTQVFGLTANPEIMSPVVLSNDTTHKVVDGIISPADLQARMLDAYAELEKECDFIIIEGSGHPGVGSIIQLSNARIARLLGAPLLLVTGGGLGNVVDRLAMIMALFEKENVDVRAILVNRLIAEKRQRSLDYLGRAMMHERFKVIGGFDYQPILANPTLRRISGLLGLPVQGNRRELQKIIYKVLVGAASTQRVTELLQEPSLILVTSSRDELLVTLAHLYRMPRYRSLIVGLIISGATPVSPITQQILDQSRMPYLRDEKRTSADLYQLIDRDVSKIIAEDTEKLALICSLAEKSFDFDAIDKLFS
ncbi:MAG TPA: AAA family ATPase [Desulfuromonadales bacterium]|nr:AAA family ATPase [Desulfuromonadales bacterium]